MSRARTALAAVIAMLFSVAPGLSLGAPKDKARVTAPRREPSPDGEKRAVPAPSKARAKSQPLGARLAADDEKAEAEPKKKAEPEAKKKAEPEAKKKAEPEAKKKAEPEAKKPDRTAKKTERTAKKTKAKPKAKRPVRALPANASWKPYRRAPWRRGHVTLFGHGKRWSGYVLNEDNEVPVAAHRSISKVLASWRTGRQTLIDERLIRLIADVSDEFGGRPIRIVSGYRERSYAHDSKHKTGEAFDFSVPGVPNDALRDFLRSLGRVGVGFYPNSTHVHLDVRDKPTYWVDYSFPGAKPSYASDRRVARWSPSERAIGAALDAIDTKATLKALSTPPATAPSLADAPGRAPAAQGRRPVPVRPSPTKPLSSAAADPTDAGARAATDGGGPGSGAQGAATGDAAPDARAATDAAPAPGAAPVTDAGGRP